IYKVYLSYTLHAGEEKSSIASKYVHTICKYGRGNKGPILVETKKPLVSQTSSALRATPLEIVALGFRKAPQEVASRLAEEGYDVQVPLYDGGTRWRLGIDLQISYIVSSLRTGLRASALSAYQLHSRRFRSSLFNAM
ncbi:hypothetical protein TWF217_007036, partial [Orbilia oligospora]